MSEVKGESVNAVLRLAGQLSDDPNIQLTILTRALVRAGKILGADRDALLGNVVFAWDAERMNKQ